MSVTSNMYNFLMNQGFTSFSTVGNVVQTYEKPFQGGRKGMSFWMSCSCTLRVEVFATDVLISSPNGCSLASPENAIGVLMNLMNSK